MPAARPSRASSAAPPQPGEHSGNGTVTAAVSNAPEAQSVSASVRSNAEATMAAAAAMATAVGDMDILGTLSFGPAVQGKRRHTSADSSAGPYDGTTRDVLQQLG